MFEGVGCCRRRRPISISHSSPISHTSLINTIGPICPKQTFNLINIINHIRITDRFSTAYNGYLKNRNSIMGTNSPKRSENQR